jgi:pimeloyl-ACP methyl ester carboxylesterase
MNTRPSKSPVVAEATMASSSPLELPIDFPGGSDLTLPDGERLHYNLHGSPDAKQKLMLIMGFLTDGAAWASQTIFFEKQGFEVVTFDNRGIARSSTPGFTKLLSYNTAQMAKDALALVNHLHWDKFHLVGVSMGGMISMELALLVQLRIQSLTLAVTHAGGPTAKTPPEGTKSVWITFFSKDENARLKAGMQRLYSKETFANAPRIAELESYHRRRMQARIPPKPVAALGHVLAVNRHYVSYPRLLRIRYAPFPTLIIVGTEDWMVQRANSDILAHVLGARLEVIPNSGHGLFLEHVDLLNKLLLEFMQQAAKRPPGDKEHKKHGKKMNPSDAAEVEAEAEDASSQLFGEEDAMLGSSFSREEEALSLVCSHTATCSVHTVMGFVTGFIPVFLALFLCFSLALHDSSEQLSHVQLAVKWALLIGALRGSYRSIRCILHSHRARSWVRRHNLLAKSASPRPPLTSAPAEESRSLIPLAARAGFEVPKHSMMLLCIFISLIWMTGIVQGLARAL